MNTNFKTLFLQSLSVMTAVCAMAAAAHADCRTTSRQTDEHFVCTHKTVFNPDGSGVDSPLQLMPR